VNTSPQSRSRLHAVADGLVCVLFAPACVSCDLPLTTPSRGVVCGACWASIQPLPAPFCPVCGDPFPSWRATPAVPCGQCRTSRPHIAGGRAIGNYDGPLRAIVQALKYEGRTSLARPLSLLMRASGGAVLAGADCVMPVPLHWTRHWRRGFNQAAALACGLGPPVMSLLRRRRRTQTQTDLPADARQRNVRDAFVLRRHACVDGMRIVLVDDVSTTGATLEACAKVLMDAGAREVRTLTAARVATRPRRGHRR
jgi:ComF family protein